MVITSTNAFGLLLMALRAGRMDTWQISERFPDRDMKITQLIKNGYIEPDGAGYRITQSGLAICPSRRSAPTLKHAAPPMQKPRTQHAKPIEPIANRMAQKAIKKVEETKMQINTDIRQPVTIMHVISAVEGKPGIAWNDVTQLLVYPDGSNKRQVSKIIANAVYNKHLVKTLVDGVYCLYLAPKKAAVREETEAVAPPVAEPVITSNIKEFKRPSPALSEVEKQEVERQYSANQVFIDATGQLIILQPGMVRMLFPAEDTRRIQKLMLAIDLESLCA